MAATKQEVQGWVTIGKAMGATHLISVCDGFDHEDYPVYCLPGDNVEEKRKDYDGKNMQYINEIIKLT